MLKISWLRVQKSNPLKAIFDKGFSFGTVNYKTEIQSIKSKKKENNFVTNT
jgi:hypothetical protein